MKKIMLLLLSVMLSMLLLLSGCAGLEGILDDEEIRGYTVTMLDGLFQNDIDKSYSTVSDVCTKQQFTSTFKDMRAALEGADSYSIERIAYNSYVNYSSDGENRITTAQYKLKTNKSDFVVSVEMRTGYNGLAAFYITPAEKTDLYYTGTIDNMKGASVTQWIILLLNIVILAVTVLAIIDCARRKIKKKALWIVIIILGMLLIGFTSGENAFRFNFSLGLFNYSAYVVYGSGNTMFRLIIPFGAIIYLCMRRSLEKKSVGQPLVPPYMQQPVQYDPAPQETSEVTMQASNSAVFCTKCGNKMDASSKFCEKCGEKLNNEENQENQENQESE